MNVAQERPRTWTPQIILFSIVLHAAILYYVAVAFKVVPGPVEIENAPTIELYDPPPPPPPLIEPEKIVEQPRFVPRQPDAPPVQPVVPPLPFPPQPATESTADANTVVLNQPIPEQPVVQGLPRYPRVAQDRQVEGKVVLSITIMPDGSVRDVRVISARPNGYFEAEALRAVQGWRYKPSKLIRQNVIVDIDFVLT
jgi:periplasmic protein TonB